MKERPSIICDLLDSQTSQTPNQPTAPSRCAQLVASASLTGAVHRFPEEVREGDAAHHDVLLLELDQRFLRYQTADGVQAPENVEDYPSCPPLSAAAKDLRRSQATR